MSKDGLRTDNVKVVHIIQFNNCKQLILHLVFLVSLYVILHVQAKYGLSRFITNYCVDEKNTRYKPTISASRKELNVR